MSFVEKSRLSKCCIKDEGNSINNLLISMLLILVASSENIKVNIRSISKDLVIFLGCFVNNSKKWLKKDDIVVLLCMCDMYILYMNCY